jgi:hypothetical protein
VLKQQGRVELDADWNEQSDILLHYIQTLARDLIGPHGGPYENSERGFGISFTDNKKDLTISPGRYYVDGILCENHAELRYRQQPNVPDEDLPLSFFAYLDVWKRHITSFEDNDLSEPALGGIDTTTRAQVVWQVKVLDLKNRAEVRRCTDLGQDFFKKSNARLRAGTVQPTGEIDPCNIEPDARYRGFENQLYRVEIHTGNVDEFGEIDDANVPAFKWSRDNGSAVFPVVKIAASSDGSGDVTVVELANLGRDDSSGLRPGNVVELVDDSSSLRSFYKTPLNDDDQGGLLKVLKVDHDRMEVTLEGKTAISVKKKNYPLLRRWDQPAGDGYAAGIPVREKDISDDTGPIAWSHDLEDGIRIQFARSESGTTYYRTGDYWLIPARTALRDVIWPKDDNGKALAKLSHGVEHHYAPLATVINGEVEDCRCTFTPNSDCAPRREGGTRAQPAKAAKTSANAEDKTAK